MVASRTLPVALFTCALIASAGVARAQPSPAEEAVLERHRLRLAAEQHEKRQEYVACAETYLQIVKLDESAEGLDEVLYNAGVCFEGGRLIGRAIETFETIERRFPSSPLTSRAIVRAGFAAAGIADYEKAARAHERYAKRYAGEKDAPHALISAITYRRALGHNKQVIENIEAFLKNYKRKLKEESAAALFILVATYESQGATKKMIKALQRYTREMGRSGGADRLLIAHAKMGAALWQSSCDSPSLDGSCIRVLRNKISASKKAASVRLPTRCGPESIANVQLVGRDQRLVREAKKYFAKALELTRRGAIDTQESMSRKAVARYWAGAARFYSSEESFEEFLSLQFPKALDFAPGSANAKQSEVRLKAWLEEGRRQRAVLIDAYTDMAGTKEPGAIFWSIAAIARAAQTSQQLSDLLQSAEIPKSMRRGPHAREGAAAYCQTLQKSASALEQQAIAGYRMCLERSQDLDLFTSWSRLCEKELGRLRPADFPLAREVHGDAWAVGDVLSSEALFFRFAIGRAESR